MMLRGEFMGGRLKRLYDELMTVTGPCRWDMHEPDEQELKVFVVGDHLDNACGAHIDAAAIAEGYQEFVVCFKRFDADNKQFVNARINLADIIALARLAGSEPRDEATDATK